MYHEMEQARISVPLFFLYNLNKCALYLFHKSEAVTVFFTNLESSEVLLFFMIFDKSLKMVRMSPLLDPSVILSEPPEEELLGRK